MGKNYECINRINTSQYKKSRMDWIKVYFYNIRCDFRNLKICEKYLASFKFWSRFSSFEIRSALSKAYFHLPKSIGRFKPYLTCMGWYSKNLKFRISII